MTLGRGLEEPRPATGRERRLTDSVAGKPVGLFMRLDSKALTAREVKKELTPSYERSCSLENDVYDDINQRAACDGEYEECEFGRETRKQNPEGKMCFHLPFLIPSLPLREVFPWGGREGVKTLCHGEGPPESSPSLLEDP